MDSLDYVKNYLESFLEITRMSINSVEQDVYAIRRSAIENEAQKRGLTNTFTPSKRIKDGRNYSYVVPNGKTTLEVCLRWHTEDSGAPVSSVSRYIETARIVIVIKKTKNYNPNAKGSDIYLKADYANKCKEWTTNRSEKWGHIPLIDDVTSDQGSDLGRIFYFYDSDVFQIQVVIFATWIVPEVWCVA